MMAFVGLGIFMMTPKLIEMIQEALKVPAFKYGTALGEALKFGWKPISGAVSVPYGVVKKEVGQVAGGVVGGQLRAAGAKYVPNLFPPPGTAGGKPATNQPVQGQAQNIP